jgi:hypothetical protein
MLMTRCEDWHKKIVKALDHEAGDQDQAEVAEHMLTCPSCRTFHDGLTRMKSEFRSIAEPDLPHGIRQHLAQEIAVEMGGQTACSSSTERTPGNSIWLRHPRWRWYQNAAAIFLIGLLGITCAVMAKRNMTLEQDLLYARQEIDLLHSLEQITGTQNSQHQTVSEQPVRVRNLEKQVKLSISPGMAWHSESPYYATEWQGDPQSKY